MTRIVLFLLSNMAIMLVLTLTTRFLGLDQYAAAHGFDYKGLLVYCGVVGFVGSFTSLAMSRWLAKRSMGVRLISGTEGSMEAWLVQTVAELARRAKISMPEVGVYSGAPNAFATGPTKNSSLIAVSTGLLQTLSRDEIEAVLSHEVSHVASGDMVTMTLLQGVVNTFVMFFARIVGNVIDRVILRNESGRGFYYYCTVLVLELMFGMVASLVVAAFSRHREFRADAGAAKLMGSPRAMMSALATLAGGPTGSLPKNISSFGISSSKSTMLGMFASHPPTEARIFALRNSTP